MGPKTKFLAALLFFAASFYHVFAPYHLFTPVETGIPATFPLDRDGYHALDQPPWQTSLNASGQTFSFNQFTFQPVAAFHCQARVLGKKAYRWDRTAAFCPVDLALGWGPMADPEIIRHFRIRQANRFYFWSTKDFPIDRAKVITSSANMHLIPANREVAQALFFVRENDMVDFQGYLVHVTRDDGYTWRTSTTRDDTGAGACEIVLVTSITRNPSPAIP